MSQAIPPLPPGFKLDAPTQGAAPPLPPGFTLDAPQGGSNTAADIAARMPTVPRAGTNDTPWMPQPQAHASPSVMDSLRTNPILGAPLQTLLRAGQGMTSLAGRGAGAIADLGGLAPNSVADAIRGGTSQLEQGFADQNKGYEGAKDRVVAASGNPRLSSAVISGGETMGHLLNPAGLAGGLVTKAPGLVGAAVRGAVSGGAFGASQPVSDNENYWGEKAKQTGLGAATGAITGSVAEALGRVKPGSSPRSEDFKEEASANYDAANKSGVVLKKSSLETALSDAEKSASKELTYREMTHPKTATAIAQVRKDLAAAGDNIGFEELDVARKIMRSALGSPEKADRAAAWHIIDKIDDYADGLSTVDVAASPSNVKGAVANLKEARAAFAKGAKLENIEDLVLRAQTKAGANQTQSRIDNAIRQQFASLKNKPAAWRRYTPDEQAAITRIIHGTKTQNAARMVGKIAPTGTIPILSELGALNHALQTGNTTLALGTVGAAGAGLAGQKIADRIGASNVDALKNAIAGRLAPPAPQFGPTPDAMVRNNIPQSLMVEMLLRKTAN